MKRKPPSPRAHHLFAWIYPHCELEGIAFNDLCDKAGVNRDTFRNAKNGTSSMSIDSVEALMNALGYTMKPSALERA